MAVAGIDLGTTFSAIAVLDQAGAPKVLPNSESSSVTTPSVVYFEYEHSMVVGENAKNTSEAYPEEVVEFVKNHMGSNKKWNFFGKNYGPEHISALILKKLVQDAEAALEEQITGVVITVPAIFGDPQRTATRLAAEVAGINLISILDEPVAAALHYGLAKTGAGQGEQNILVYDLGGGTFDLTVMRVSENAVQMLWTGGDRELGGKLWDDVLIKFVAENFLNEHGSDPRDSAQTRQSLRLAAESAKRQLTQKEKAAITCHHEGKLQRVEITRDKFNELTASLLERTETITEMAIQELTEQGILKGWQDIYQVLLVGGSSKMPQVNELIKRLWGKEPKLFDPDLAVAKGAALFSVMELLRVDKETGVSARLKEHNLQRDDFAGLAEVKVTRVCSFAIGQKLVRDGWNERQGDPRPEDHIAAIRIPKNTPLPARKSAPCYTIRDNQNSVAITILEGEDPDPDYCIEIGEGIISNIPPLPKGSEVVVAIELSEESLIKVSAAVTVAPQARVDFELRRKNSSNIDVNLARADVNITAVTG